MNYRPARRRSRAASEAGPLASPSEMKWAAPHGAASLAGDVVLRLPWSKPALCVLRNVSGQGHQPLHPFDDAGIEGHVEVGLVGDMGVRKQANICEAEDTPDKPVATPQMVVHQS